MSEITPSGIFEKLTNLGSDWADKKASAEQLERNAKNSLSLFFNHHKSAGKGVEEAKHLAQVEPDYQTIAEAAIEASRDTMRAKVKYEAALTYFEAWRTIEANHRAAARSGS